MRPTLTGIEDALADAGGVAAPRDRVGQIRSLLAKELAHGVAELAQTRSGYDHPVVVAVATAPDGLRAVAPVAPEVRADPDAIDERAWLLTAALVGALVDATLGGELTAGVLDGQLALRVATRDADPELAVIAFEEHVAPIDRLRARALALPTGALDDAADLRPPIGATHPLNVALQVALLGGHPADPVDVAAREDAVVAVLQPPEDREVARPHDDPDPSRRVARRILQRLDGMGKWGGYHTDFTHLARGFAGNDRALADTVGEALLAAGLLAEKPSVGQRHVFLNPRRAGDIRRLIDDGDVPRDLDLP